MNIDKLLRDNIKRLSPYSTARDEYKGEIGVYLDANENPYDTGYNRYPDPYQKEIKQQLSEIKGVDPEKIFIGNGSDEPIDLLYRIFCVPGKDNVVTITPTYGMYKVSAEINDVEVRELELEADFKLNSKKLLALSDSDTKLIFLCSPNNPSANLLDEEEVLAVIENFQGIVIVDEAYIDFAESESFTKRLDEYPNLVVLQTLSKAWGLAGVRFGLAFASKEIIHIMTKIKYPYNINVLSQNLVFEELKKVDLRKSQIEEIVRERERVVEVLSELPYIEKVYPSDANFVLIKVEDACRLYSYLIVEKVIVRNRNSVRGCKGCIRITIGTPQENERLLKLMNDYKL